MNSIATSQSFNLLCLSSNIISTLFNHFCKAFSFIVKLSSCYYFCKLLNCCTNNSIYRFASNVTCREHQFIDLRQTLHLHTMVVVFFW
jgi:hypothetical protein